MGAYDRCPCFLKQLKKGEPLMFGFDRITSDPNIIGGKACIRGMRISVSLIVNLVANGMSFVEILAEYPDLELEDIRQALRYAAWAADDIVYVPAGVAR
jgi:uncharacterized protein (DUF433 family)